MKSIKKQDRLISLPILIYFNALKQLNCYKIAEIRKRIEAQSATIDLVAKDSAYAKNLSNELSEKTKVASESLKKIKLYTEFNTTFIASQNNSRKAFEQVKNPRPKDVAL